MSIQAVGWVLEYSTATMGSRLVLLSIANHADKSGFGAFPSHETLAREAHLSVRQISRCVLALEADGHVQVERAHRQANRYVIVGCGLSDISVIEGAKRAVKESPRVTSVPVLSDIRDKKMSQMSPQPSLAVEAEPKNTPPAPAATAPGGVTSLLDRMEARARQLPPAAPPKVLPAPEALVAPRTQPRPKPALVVEPGVQAFLQAYQAAFSKRFEAAPPIQYGRDGATVKRLLKQYGYDKLWSLMERYLESSERFVVEAGYSLGVFASRISGLLVAESGRVAARGSGKTQDNAEAVRQFLATE